MNVCKSRLFSLAAVGLLTAALTASAQSGPLRVLEMRFNVGEVNRYRTTAQTIVTIPVPGQALPNKTTLDVDLSQRMRAIRALPHGGGEVESATTAGAIYMNGSPNSEPDSKPFTITYDARGNVASIKGLTAQSSLGGMLGSGSLGMQSAFLPGHPVRQGQTWQQPMRLPGMPVAGAGTVSCRWMATERIGRYETARIRTFLAQPLKIMLTGDAQPTQDPRRAVYVMTGMLSVTFISNFAIAEGKVIRSSGIGGASLNSHLKGAAPKKKMAQTVPEGSKLTLKMRIGYNLVE